MPGKLRQALKDRRLRGRAHRQVAQLAGTEQDELVAQLRAELAELDGQSHPDAVRSPTWAEIRDRLVDRLFNDDPREFLTWQVVHEALFRATFFRMSDWIDVEYEALRARPAWRSRWAAAITEDPAGCPPRWSGNPETSANLIHHAYHLLRFEQFAGRSVGDLDEIVEFGGGYGSMARLARRLGFGGRYHIHDFPELNALQRYFLRSVDLTRGLETADRTSFGNDIEAVPPRDGGSTRLFIATWSLSETPLEVRDAWSEAIAASTDVIVAFQHEFEGIDNRRWFEDLCRGLPFSWERTEIAHIPGNSYVIGRPSQGRVA